LLAESVLESDILPLNPSKLAQLLVERIDEHRHAGSSALIQETYAESFSLLLRLDERTKCKQHGANRVENQFGSASVVCCPPPGVRKGLMRRIT
jgi:hypothetical protein